MDDYARKCSDYIKQHGVDAEQLTFDTPVRTAKEAAERVGSASLVKTVVLWAGGTCVACVLRAMDKVDLGRMREILGTGNVRVATRDEVLAATGYPAGGVPPFGHGLKTFVDSAVQGMGIVHSGGGSDWTLLKTSDAAIIKATGAVVERIATST